MDISEFYRNAEDMVLGVFKEQGGWQPMAVALMPGGMGMIKIGETVDDDDARAASQLRRTLKLNHAQAYVVAYTVLKMHPEKDMGDRRMLGPVINMVDDGDDMQASPDQMLFLFMSDNLGHGQVHAYSVIERGRKIGPRQRWLEEADSPFHRLLGDGPILMP